MWSLLAVFVALAGVALGEINVGRLTSPLYRYFSAVHPKHVYHHDAEFVNNFYGPDAKYFISEGHLGNVLPYSTYTKNKEAIDKACPELVVYKSVFKPTHGNSRANFDQSFAMENEPLARRMIDEGPIFLAASKKGYCGATKAVYLADSNRPRIQDWFYTTHESEFIEATTKNIWYNRPGNAKGVVFYIWEQQQDSKSPIEVPTISEEPFSEEEVQKMTSPLHRFFSGALTKHVYHYDTDYLKLLGPNAPVFAKDVKMGNVLPYATYKENKEAIDKACPDLITLDNVVQVYGDGSRSQWDQAFAVENNPGKTLYPLASAVVSASLENQGPIFLAAKEKGYCGANKAVYLSDSNRPAVHDWFYTSSAGEYRNVIKNNIFYNKPGNAKGIVFYIW